MSLRSEADKYLEDHRYAKDETPSGFPQNWLSPSVYENKLNQNYDDSYFNYDFPNSYPEQFWWMKKRIESWLARNRNNTIKYIVRINWFNEYKIYNVKILNIDYKKMKIKFRVIS